MKSLANRLLDIASGICKDIRVAYPQYAGLDLDIERLARNCQTRGLGLFTLDLPCLDSILLHGLEHGRLDPKGPLSRVVSRRTKVPRLFEGLWLRVFDRTGCLLLEPDVNAIFFLRQIFCFGKKIRIACSPDRIKDAVREYHDIENEIVPHSLSWDKDVFDPEARLCGISLADYCIDDLPLFPGETGRGCRKLRGLLDKVQQVADFIAGAMPFFEPLYYSYKRELEGHGTGFRHGPGAVADRRGIVNKYDMPRWSTKLEEWFPYRECGTIASDEESIPRNHEVASRLIAVPKTAKAPRLIAAEPTEHQWCQQLIRHYMVRELKTLFGQKFVCFEKQELSGHMALQASLDRSLATIDLSSASDRLSCWTVERILRRNPSLLHALHATRTRYIRSDLDGCSFIKLKKFASQGTAVTFPVQTLVFLIIALGCSIQGPVTWSSLRRLGNKVRVFGDDIIIPRDRYDDVTTVLTALGLKVNMEKSFHKGHFRESCGVDAYLGCCITPVKPAVVVSDGPQSRQAVIDTTNNLFMKGLWHASTDLRSTLGNRLLRRLPVVGPDCGAVGLRSFCGRRLDHLTSRWNTSLHRTEYRVWKLRSRTRKQPTGDRFAMLQFFTEAPYSQYNWEHGTAIRPKTSDGLGWDPLY